MPNTILGITRHLRKMIKLAIGKGIISRDPFEGYAPEGPKAQQKYLTREELDRIITTQLDHPYRYLTRDMFLFAAFTGMAYANVRNLSEKHLITDEDGMRWIKINRQKTKAECNIRLLSLPIQIMEKYRHERMDDKIFRMTCLGTIDRNLKEVAKRCGIDSRLTYHQSRHTYATQVCISQGVPIETLCKMMGHRSVKATQIYAKITNQKVNEDMKILSNRIENKYDLPKDDIPEFTHNQYLYDKEMGRVVYVENGNGKDYSRRKK